MANHNFDCSNLLCNEVTSGLGFYGDDAFDDHFHFESCKDGTDDRSEMGFRNEELYDLPCLSDESIAWMLERENSHLPRDDYLPRLRSGDLDVNLRQEAISWMFKACAQNSLTELSLYTALNFFDRFISMYTIPEEKPWMIHLASVVCLLLAAKLEECIVPPAEELQGCQSESFYNGETIHAMEISVLKCLKWNMKSHTPFNYLDYFFRKINQGEIPLSVMMSRSGEIISASIEGIDYLEFKPSEIAAAVAVYVSREMYAIDIEQAMSSCTLIEKDRVVKCLKTIQDLPLLNPLARTLSPIAYSPTPLNPPAPPPSPVSQSPSGVLSYKSDETTDGSFTSSSSSRGGNSSETKRRKLDTH